VRARLRPQAGGVLLATDVAARGLDIRDLEYVIHYHMPHTVEAYVHRSGRTARAQAAGICIALVDPPDEKRYRMICHGLGPETAAGFKPYDALGGVVDVLPRVHRAINLAMKLDSDLHQARKKRADSDWIQRAAKEMDVELDDELAEEVEASKAQQRESSVSKKEQQRVRDELHRLLLNISRPTSMQRATAPHGVPLPI
jgi:ATP-dependent RNA helicase DDX24/MAK5